MKKILFNFIINHFLSANLNAVVFFHCWDLKTQRPLAHMVSQQLWHTRFLNVDAIDLAGDFEYRYLLHKRPVLGAFLDMNCDGTEKVINTLSRWRLYSARYNWLLYDRTADLANFKRLFTNAKLSVDTQLTYATLNSTPLLGSKTTSNDNKNATQYFIKYDVYNNGRFLGGKLNVTVDREFKCNRVGCHVSRFLSQLHLRKKYGHRSRLHDITLRVSTALTQRPISAPEPELIAFLLSVNNTTVDSLARFGFHIFMILKDFFGSKMIHTFRPNWGINETYGGTIGDLIDERADLISTAFIITKDRLRYLSPIAETGFYRSVCLFRTPRTPSLKGDAFFQPFDAAVWLLFGLLLALLAVVHWLIFSLELRSNLRQHLPYKPSLLSTLLMAFGAACCQGSIIVPFSLGGRLGFLSLCFLTFIVYNYYTSILLSTLLGSPPKSSIKTLAQLADSSLEVALEPLPYNFVYLNTSALPEVRRFVSRKIESKRPPAKAWISSMEGILRIRDEPGFVYVLEASNSYPIVERIYSPQAICDLNEVSLRPDRSIYTHLHKNSTFKEFLRPKVVRILETGVYRKHRRYWAKETLNCEKGTYLLAVGMGDTAPLFLLLLFSFGICLLLLGLEIVTERALERQPSEMRGKRLFVVENWKK